MDVQFSPDANILSIHLANKPVDHAEEADPFIVHMAEDGTLVLIEILDASEFVEKARNQMLTAKRTPL